MRWAVIAMAVAGLAACSSDPAISPPVGAGGLGGAGGEGGSGGDGGAASGGGGAGGEAPAPSCWDQGPEGWVLGEAIDTTALTGTAVVDLTLSADGLELWYGARADENALIRPHRAIRASRDEPFTGGEQIAVWAGLTNASSVPPRGDEMLVRSANGQGQFNAFVSLREGDDWSYPTPLGAAVNVPDTLTTHLTMTELGTRLIFARAPVGNEVQYSLWEAARSSGEPGTPFGISNRMTFPNVPDDERVLCGSLSPDGTILHFSRVLLEDANNDGLVNVGDLQPGDGTIWMATRATIDHPWSPPAEIPALTSETISLPCVTVGITDDGCEMIVDHVEQLGQGSVFRVARRTPIR